MKQDNICPTCGRRQPSSDQVLMLRKMVAWIEKLRRADGVLQAGALLTMAADLDKARAMISAAEAEGKNGD